MYWIDTNEVLVQKNELLIKKGTSALLDYLSMRLDSSTRASSSGWPTHRWSSGWQSWGSGGATEHRSRDRGRGDPRCGRRPSGRARTFCGRTPLREDAFEQLLQKNEPLKKCLTTKVIRIRLGTQTSYCKQEFQFGDHKPSHNWPGRKVRVSGQSKGGKDMLT